ncbi:uncharacterized protein [Anabrus simplex]|uniref:uncharacterized protein n=1 Tax=Anabrus simplex TaxID=316456 RepID=UPI0035A27EC4
MYGRPVLVLLLLSLCHAETTLDSNDPVGTPGELAWQAWLLMDEATDSSSTSTVVRRIKPKSVFIAPSFSPQSLPACADGYRADAMGRCVKLVRVNQAAQLDFLLQRLNSMYAQPERAPGAPPASESNEPLQVNLPIEPATNKKRKEEGPGKVQPVLEEPMEVSVVMADVSKRSSNNDSSEESKEPVITMWSVENNTLPKREGTMSEDTSTQSANKDGDPTTFNIPLPPSSDVLAPTDVEDSLPMLVFSPEDSAEVEQLSLVQNTSTENTTTDSIEGNSKEESDEKSKSEDQFLQVTTTVPTTEIGITDIVNSTDDNPPTVDDIDLRINISNDEPHKINETLLHANNSDNEPLPLNDSDTQVRKHSTSLSVEEESDDRIVEVVQKVPAPDFEAVDIPEVTETSHIDDEFSSESDVFTTEYPQTMGRSPSSGFVRFPSEVNDDPSSFHIFGRNYVKFPTDDPSFNKYKSTSRPQSLEKPTYWWLPPGWRIDRQRHQPTLLRFWSRMPLRSDSSSYHPSYDRGHHSTHQSNFHQDWSSRYREHRKK